MKLLALAEPTFWKVIVCVVAVPPGTCPVGAPKTSIVVQLEEFVVNGVFVPPVE